MAEINIKGISKKRVTVTITGDSGLIVHQFGEKAKRMMMENMTTKKKKAEKRELKNPDQEYESCFYYCEDDKTYGFPALCIKNAIVAACRSIDGLPMTMVRQWFFVIGDKKGMIPVKFENIERREDRVRVNKGGADIRIRPEFQGWSMDVTIEYNSDTTSEEQLIKLLSIAGFGNGLGEWRPERNGEFGRFHVGN